MSATLEKTRKNVWDVDFPDNWEISNIGKVTTKIGSGATPKGGASVYQESGTPLFRSLNIHNEGFRDKNLAFINDEQAEQLAYASVQEGDVLFNITGASILRSSIAPPSLVPARVNQHVAILRPNERVTPAFLHAWLISPRMHSFMYSQSHGSTREAITKEQLQRLPIALPPLTEQEAITELLDAKTREIDKLVERLEEERELLERYRCELIAHTVTHGLNPDAPLRDSGIDWLGRIPQSWVITNLSTVTFENKAKNSDSSERNLLSLSFGRIVRKDIEGADGLLPESFTSYQIVDPGTIILRLTDLQNDKRSLRTAIAQERGIITSAYVGLKVRSDLSSEYLAWLLRFYDLTGIFYSLGGGVRQSSNYKEVGTIPVPIPPLREQEAIGEFLNSKSREIDRTVADITSQIANLELYRRQLIEALVTGRVRVEEAA